MSNKAKSNGGKIGFWHMMRDVLIASMNKGQFPMAVMSMMAIIVILKMPGEDVSKLAFKVYEGFSKGHLLGYFLSVVLAFAWFFHSKYQRRIVAVELERITEQRNKLQSKRIGQKLESSQGRR